MPRKEEKAAEAAHDDDDDNSQDEEKLVARHGKAIGEKARNGKRGRSVDDEEATTEVPQKRSKTGKINRFVVPASTNTIEMLDTNGSRSSITSAPTGKRKPGRPAGSRNEKTIQAEQAEQAAVIAQRTAMIAARSVQQSSSQPKDTRAGNILSQPFMGAPQYGSSLAVSGHPLLGGSQPYINTRPAYYGPEVSLADCLSIF